MLLKLTKLTKKSLAINQYILETLIFSSNAFNIHFDIQKDKLQTTEPRTVQFWAPSFLTFRTSLCFVKICTLEIEVKGKFLHYIFL